MKLTSYQIPTISVTPAVLNPRPLLAAPHIKNNVSLQYDHPYLLNRRVDPTIAQEMGIGYFNQRILFSVDNAYGDFVGYVLRVLDNSEPKYDFSHLSKTHYLYNYHRARAANRPAIILVEGFFDSVAVRQAGYPSVVALMGSNMSQKQEDLLTRYWDYVIFMMDGDAAGKAMQKEGMARLNKRQLKGVFGIDLPDKTQPDQLNPAQVREFIANPRK